MSAKGILRACALLLLLACAFFGQDLNSLKPQGYVSDFAGVLQPASRQSLETYCARLEQATGAQLALVTIQSLNGQPIEDYANTLFRKWGIGKKGQDNGVLLLLAIADRQNRIEVGYGLEPILPDGFVGSILRSIRPYLRQADYSSAMLAAAQQMGSRIAAAKGVTLDFALKDAPTPAAAQPGIPWPLIIFGIIVLFLLFGRGRGGGGFLTGMLLGNLFGRYGGGGRWSGGGFGGYDGGGGAGGGFGGFGGGDSGGGGASSNW